MSKKTTLLLFIVIVTVGVALFLRPKNDAVKNSVQPETAASPNHTPETSFIQGEDRPKSGEPRVAPPENTGTIGQEAKRESLKPILEIAPTLEIYRDEIAKNPHGAPPSLRKFSEAMAAKMEPALKDQAVARDLLPELGECVKRATVTTVQQSCLVNSKRLAEKHPDLATDVKSIEESAPADVKKRMKLLGM